MNKPYAGKWDPETGELLKEFAINIDSNWMGKLRHAEKADAGYRFLCPNGHVTEVALQVKRKGARHCSKLVAYGRCAYPVDQIFWRSLRSLFVRGFRAGASQ
jgi:hypothetical protein